MSTDTGPWSPIMDYGQYVYLNWDLVILSTGTAVWLLCLLILQCGHYVC